MTRAVAVSPSERARRSPAALRTGRPDRAGAVGAPHLAGSFLSVSPPVRSLRATRTRQRLVTRSDLAILPDPTRVLARLFVPGLDLVSDTESTASPLLSRLLSLSDEAVASTLAATCERFGGRHRDLRSAWLANYEQVAHRLADPSALTDERRLLIGACFTNEYSIEGAALFNPSAVAHPDQSGLRPGAVRFVLSLRAVGEGHVSSLEFRSGVVGPGHRLRLEHSGRFAEAGIHRQTTYDREVFRKKLEEAGAGTESSSLILSALPTRFEAEALHRALDSLADKSLARREARRSVDLARRIATCSYEVDFNQATALSERVIFPHAPSESHGIEDARFVRFVDDDGTARYFATYTAFDGAEVRPQMIETSDFSSFAMSQISGPAAKNKGMALFPRKIGGSFVALSRCDRENNSIATSPDGRRWGEPTTLKYPDQPWEVIQLGNAGSPIETPSGWLVITHGVGPMREYCLGAILLDLDDPTTVIGALRRPLMVPEQDERDGYVPNVLYSCGAMAYGDDLLLPYAVSDSSVRFAFVNVPLLLCRLATDGPCVGFPAPRGSTGHLARKESVS
ncbi:MAG: glycoside hydrolase family 130 protein [Acidimicrobiales bacterium]